MTFQKINSGMSVPPLGFLEHSQRKVTGPSTTLKVGIHFKSMSVPGLVAGIYSNNMGLV